MDAFKKENVIIDSFVFDSHYNFYVADSKNSTVYKYTPLGKLIPFRNKWNPYSLVVDSNDNVFVADQNGPIHKISPSGEISEFLSPSSIDNKTIDLSQSHSFTIDLSDNLYLIDQKSGNITKISPFGQVSTFGQLPNKDEETQSSSVSSSSSLCEIAVDSRGWLFAYRIGVIYIYNEQGTLTEEIKSPSELLPVKIAMDWDNNLYWTTVNGIIVGLDASDDARHHALDHIKSRHDSYRSNYAKRMEKAKEREEEELEHKTTTTTNQTQHHSHVAHVATEDTPVGDKLVGGENTENTENTSDSDRHTQKEETNNTSTTNE